MNLNLWILLLALTGLLVVVLRLRRRRRAKTRLVRDDCGLWRYHRDTVFEWKSAYGRTLKVDDADKESEKAVAVLSFDGDLRARSHKAFARLVDEVVVNRENLEEVVVVIQSAGGIVPYYGHVFSQMERLRALGLQLTACVDVVAASGGYLMALPAKKIIAAPFAMVGSVGVLAFVPNIRKLLLNWDINPRTYTAGRYKRTVSMTDDASEEEETRFRGQLEAIHRLFLSAVEKYRKAVNVETVGTGEHWTAQESQTLELGLVDEIGTSQEYLLQKNQTHDLAVFSHKKNLLDDGLSNLMSLAGAEIEKRFAA